MITCIGIGSGFLFLCSSMTGWFANCSTKNESSLLGRKKINRVRMVRMSTRQEENKERRWCLLTCRLMETLSKTCV